MDIPLSILALAGASVAAGVMWSVYRAICKISLSSLDAVSDLIRMQDASNRETVVRFEAAFDKTLAHLKETQMANGTPISYLVAEREAAVHREEKERSAQHEINMARLEVQKHLSRPAIVGDGSSRPEPDSRAKAMGE